MNVIFRVWFFRLPWGSTADLSSAISGAQLVLRAEPVGRPEDMLQEARRPLPVVWLCKGFEEGTGLLPHQVAAETLGENGKCGALSRSVLRGGSRPRPALRADARLARPPTSRAKSAALLHGGRMRVYYSADVVGVEIGGAVKNVMAIAAGISDGWPRARTPRASSPAASPRSRAPQRRARGQPEPP